MPKVTEEIKVQAKEMVLEHVSYRKIAAKFGVDQRDIYNALRNDPDIVAARVAGQLNPPRNRDHVSDYTQHPWVIDVLEHGMTQTAAAIKHGKSQPYVNQCVKKAKAQLEHTLNREPPPPPTPPTQDPEIAAISTLITAYALRHNLTTASVLDNLASLLQSGTR